MILPAQADLNRLANQRLGRQRTDQGHRPAGHDRDPGRARQSPHQAGIGRIDQYSKFVRRLLKGLGPDPR